jgi:hypothetical protein
MFWKSKERVEKKMNYQKGITIMKSTNYNRERVVVSDRERPPFFIFPTKNYEKYNTQIAFVIFMTFISIWLISFY